MQFSAEYIYAVTGGTEGGQDHEDYDGPTFIEFMDAKVAEYVAAGVPKDMAELAAEDAWFAADGDGYDSEAERESYYRSIGYTDTEAHAAAVDDQAGEPASV